ncbi:DUF1351 domain-containing protein [Caproiciproducens galactitolivorans]|nr:DUF1351 domain-containing protein [Caproiciproducens galactitolivorans]
MELIMTTDLAKVLPRSIDFNHEQLKAELSQKLDYYNNLVVTEDSIKSAKADKVTLNKLRAALDDKRKEVKKDCLTPYEDFERKVKELICMIDKPIAAIDGQIKAFDEQKRSEKQDEIMRFFCEKIGDLEPLLPFEKIFNPRWLNATYKMSDIEKEITETIFKVRNNINIIKAFDVDCEQQMLDKYLETLDMSAAMAEKTRWEEQQKRLKEYEESQRKAQEAVKTAPDETTSEQKETSPEQPAPQSYIPEPEQCHAREQLKTISVTFHDTTAEFRHGMHDLCVKYGIKYGWAKKEDLE